MERLEYPENFVACDLKIGRCRQFTELIIMSVLEVKFTFHPDQYDLSHRSFINDHISGERYQDHMCIKVFYIAIY